jgi:hypothetical protein
VSECSPKDVRGRITGLFQIMVAAGVMISYFMNCVFSSSLASKFILIKTTPDGISLKPSLAGSPIVWRLPFGFQLVPAGIMCFGLLTVKESPRWLASVGRSEQALANLAYLRKLHPEDPAIRHEFSEIEAAILEEQEARKGLGIKEAFFGKGNFIRFVIAFVIFTLQQWSGQNSVGYYAPQIFKAIGYTGQTPSLLASGIYGVVKFVATTIFVFFFVETLGRKLSLLISAIGMGVFFFIIGAILKTHPPVVNNTGAVPQASQAMAGMIYIYVLFYSMGWGPLPWVYVSDIFPTRTRHYGLAVASCTQWLWSAFSPVLLSNARSLISILRRLRRVEGDTNNRHQFGFQDLPHVRNYKHCRHGHLLPSHSRNKGPLTGGDGRHLWCRFPAAARPRRGEIRARDCSRPERHNKPAEHREQGVAETSSTLPPLILSRSVDGLVYPSRCQHSYFPVLSP